MQEIATIAYNMKRCLRFFLTFHILNIAKFDKIYLWIIVTWEKSQNWKKIKNIFGGHIKTQKGTSSICYFGPHFGPTLLMDPPFGPIHKAHQSVDRP